MTCRVRLRSPASNPHDLAALLNWLAAVFAAPPDREAVASYRRGPPANG